MNIFFSSKKSYFGERWVNAFFDINFIKPLKKNLHSIIRCKAIFQGVEGASSINYIENQNVKIESIVSDKNRIEFISEISIDEHGLLSDLTKYMV